MLFCITTDESADNGGRMVVLDTVDNRVYFMGDMAEFRYIELTEENDTTADAWVIITLRGQEGTRIDLLESIYAEMPEMDSSAQKAWKARRTRFMLIVDMFDKFSANEHKDF